MPLLPTDLMKLGQDKIPFAIKDVMRAHPKKVVLAGGFIRSVIADEKISDIDLFVPNQDLAHEVAKEIGAASIPCFSSWALRSHCLSLPTKPWTTQISWRRPFEAPEEVAAAFDFTICMAGMWKTGTDYNCGWESWVHDYFYPDLKSRVLRYMDPDREEVGGEAFLRVLKFVSRGYKISIEELSTIVDRLASSANGLSGDDAIYDILKRSDSSSDAGSLSYFKQLP